MEIVLPCLVRPVVLVQAGEGAGVHPLGTVGGAHSLLLAVLCVVGCLIGLLLGSGNRPRIWTVDRGSGTARGSGDEVVVAAVP